MRTVIQRVTHAEVGVAGQTVAAIGPGVLILLGIAATDRPEDAALLAEKIPGLRLFADGDRGFARSLRDSGGEALVVSQFTLLARLDRGTRPSFNAAAPAAVAEPLYQAFLSQLGRHLGRAPARGVFGADMQVTLTNDGPVTLIFDSP